jgi:predicted transport protein
MGLPKHDIKLKSIYAKNYTPITSYMKNLKDSKITKDYGQNYMAFRSNLNFS